VLIAMPARGEDPPQPVIDWRPGPAVGELASHARIQIPEQFLFTDKKGARKLLELTHNIPSGAEVGAMVPQGDAEADQWFVTFEFQDMGFVKDDEKGTIDAEALLEAMRKGTEAANAERKRKGWGTFHVVGWEKPPYYDPATNHLTWAIRGRSESGSESINHSVRLLGRRGTMNVDLVLAADQYTANVGRFEQMMSGFVFNDGHRYADFVKGDKVAAYGLTALIAGGAGVAAAKTGLLAKFWKVIAVALIAMKKFVIVLVLGALAGLKKLFDVIRGRGSVEEVPRTTGTGGTPSV
jgi:uncharacterized membrane-anchored protein